MRLTTFWALLGLAGVVSGQASLTVNLTDALERARAYSPQFLSAGLAAGSAREDKLQAKAALLPTLNAINGVIYTQGNGTDSGVFVANNGVHVYDEQAAVHAELFAVSKNAAYRRTIAAEAAARARQDVARRGLTITVIQSYYMLVAAERRVANSRQSLDEARRFADLSQKLEAGGEAARADVVKAQLQVRQRERQVREAETDIEKARLGLAVLLFPDLGQAFTVVDDLRADLTLESAGDLRQQSIAANPDLRVAESMVEVARFGVKVARGEYFPSLNIDYLYGIDANRFAFRGPDNRQNLGSVVQASVTVPVWNWGATRSRVRQSELQKRQAELDLSFARRQLDATVSGLYVEAQAAGAQIPSLAETVDLASESVRLTLLRYQAGEATALEVVDSQSVAADARNANADGLARYRVAVAGLETLAGRY